MHFTWYLFHTVWYMLKDEYLQYSQNLPHKMWVISVKRIHNAACCWCKYAGIKPLSYHKKVSRFLKKPVDSIKFTELGQHCLESRRYIQLQHTLNKLVHHNGTGMSLYKHSVTVTTVIINHLMFILSLTHTIFYVLMTVWLLHQSHSHLLFHYYP